MKTIMCYGDSLTWGYNPGTGTRYPFDERWPGILQQELGSSFRVIEEALNGRTMCMESELLPEKSGSAMLGPLLESHAPIDIFVLMLGTNDVAPMYHLNASDIGAYSYALIRKIQKSQAGPGGGAPDVLLIAPPPLDQLSGIDQLFYGGGQEASRNLAGAYKTVADAVGCSFLDSGRHIKTCDMDGVHIDAAGHRMLAMEVKKVVDRLAMRQPA